MNIRLNKIMNLNNAKKIKDKASTINLIKNLQKEKMQNLKKKKQL